jgi:hypothetical protein
LAKEYQAKKNDKSSSSTDEGLPAGGVINKRIDVNNWMNFFEESVMKMSGHIDVVKNGVHARDFNADAKKFEGLISHKVEELDKEHRVKYHEDNELNYTIFFAQEVTIPFIKREMRVIRLSYLNLDGISSS